MIKINKLYKVYEYFRYKMDIKQSKTQKLTSVKILKSDVMRLDDDCKKVLRSNNKELVNLKLSRDYVINKVIDFYLVCHKV